MVNGYNELTEQESYSDIFQLMRLVPGNMIENDFHGCYGQDTVGLTNSTVAQKT